MRTIERDSQHALVVDDNMAMAGVIRYSLERAGFRVTLAHNGKDACSALQHAAVDIVITDYQMPKMNGEQLCRWIKQHGEYTEIPIIMLTCKRMELETDRLQQQWGVAAILPKPFSPAELVRRVNEQLRAGAACEGDAGQAT